MQDITNFCSFLSDKNENKYQTHLLGFCPLEDETYLGAKKYEQLVEYILEYYEKSWKNVNHLIGNNFN